MKTWANSERGLHPKDLVCWETLECYDDKGRLLSFADKDTLDSIEALVVYLANNCEIGGYLALLREGKLTRFYKVVGETPLVLPRFVAAPEVALLHIGPRKIGAVALRV